MIDFSILPRKNKTYAGANGSKISVIYNNEQYMLKFPPAPRKNLDMSYTNSCISELQKQFYITMLRHRKEHIIDYSLEALKKKERTKKNKGAR